MKMTLNCDEGEEVTFDEMRIELDYISKRWNVYFGKYLSGWEIICYPKKKLKSEVWK